MNYASKDGTCAGKSLAWVAAVLLVILGFLFSRSFQTGLVHFSNDGPLGNLSSKAIEMPSGFSGIWTDLHWIGSHGGTAPISITWSLLSILGPVKFAKCYPPISLFILGLAAWTFFRTLGLKNGLAVVGAIAAALNSNFLSNTAWGLGTRSLTLAMMFFALALLSLRPTEKWWINWFRAILAGFCVGMGVIEGADNGAILSVFVAAFVIARAYFEEPTLAARARRGSRLVWVVLAAAIMATQSFSSVIQGKILSSGTAATAKVDPQAAKRDYDFSTQWSLPPVETLRVIIPGLFGYRMDTPDGGYYWGRVGEAPSAPGGGTRMSGAGEYAGVLVVLVAFWAVFASTRKSYGVYSDAERYVIWSLVGMGVVAVLLAWGRYTGLYEQTMYKLPYFSSIRNPIKYMHPCHMILMILFGYGLLGFSRRYLAGGATKLVPGNGTIKSWWAKAVPLEKRWVYGSFAAGALAVLSFLVYSGSRAGLEKRIFNAGFPDTTFAAEIARFSVNEVGLFALFLLLSVGLVFLVMRGVFAGSRAHWGAIALGLLLTVDLVRASTPWIIYWNYSQKYASNPILDILRAKPYEGRVVAPPGMASAQGMQLSDLTRRFAELYAIEWVQHHFQDYDIQSIDVSQDPRPPVDKQNYTSVVGVDLGRYWELTNTRWVLGLAGYLQALNTQIDKGKNRFRLAALFDIGVKPPPRAETRFQLEYLTAVPTSNGPLALIEFTGALPRAKLYPHWFVMTNGDEALKKLVDPAFDPATAVVVSDNIPPPSPAADTTNAAPATVDFTSYAPKRIELKTSAAVPTVLLLNDRFDPAWQATIDGQPAKILRANYIMRGVQLPAGQHNVVFTFRPSLTGMKVTLAAVGFALLLCGVVLFSLCKTEEPAASNEGNKSKPEGPKPKA